MASDLGFDTYKRYKASTERFVSWLAEVAEACGKGLEKCNGGRSAPSQKTKKQKATQNYEISVRNLVELANTVAQSEKPQIVVPRLVYNLLCEVIALRKEAAIIFGQIVCHDHGDNGNQEVDGHSYFIGVLEQVREILSPLTEKAPVKVEIDSEDHVRNLANIFEALDVEDPKDAPSDNVSATPSSAPIKSSKKTVKKRYLYSFEPTHDDVFVSSLFFFHDLNQIRKILKGLWTAYKVGHEDLTTASLVTNTAIELVQRNLEEHFTMMAQWRGIHAPNQHDWIRWVYNHICGGIGKDPEIRHLKSDVINFATYKEADYVCLLASYHVEDFFDSLHPEHLVFPEGSGRNAICGKSARDRYNDDDNFVSRFLAELHNATKIGCSFPPAVDAITRAFIVDQVSEIQTRNTFPIWLVFAVQILLDINHVLRQDSSLGFRQLQATSERVTGIIRNLFQYSRSMKNKQTEWHEVNEPRMLLSVKFISAWIKKDPIIDGIRACTEIGPEQRGFKLTPNYLLKAHPLFCGILVYWLELVLQEISIGFSCAYQSILSVTHLYNAAKQSKTLETTWPDMEFLIAVHTEQAMFVGGRPSRQADFWKRFQMVLGASATNFSRDRNSSRPLEAAKDNRSRRLQFSSPIHDVFRTPHYRDTTEHADLRDTKFGAVISDVARKHPENQLIAKYAQAWTKNRKLSSVEVLAVLGVALADETIHLRFDYVSMEIRCANLISSIRSKFIGDARDLSQFAALPPSITDARDISKYSTCPSLVADEKDPSKYTVSRPEGRGDSLVAVPVNSNFVEYLEMEMAESPMVAIKTTQAIFLANPQTAPVANEKAISRLEKRSLILASAGVNLRKVGKVMEDVVVREGRLELEKAELFCKSKVSKV